MGDAIPSITIKNDGSIDMWVINAISGEAKTQKIIPVTLSTAQWTEIRVKQYIQADSTYMFKVMWNGQVVLAMQNTTPRDWQNVKVYASDPRSNPARASIRNLKVISKLADKIPGNT